MRCTMRMIISIRAGTVLLALLGVGIWHEEGAMTIVSVVTAPWRDVRWATRGGVLARACTGAACVPGCARTVCDAAGKMGIPHSRPCGPSAGHAIAERSSAGSAPPQGRV
jgi:hypothetical protein